VISWTDIEEARKAILGTVFLSPCAYSETLSRLTGTKCWLKLENLQMTGSFKERGAVNKLSRLTPEERARGVICASAGNHAQGVAYHAERMGIAATVVMPQGTPLIKIQGARNYGANVVLYGASYDDAFEEATRLAAAQGYVFIHAFDDDATIAGQGTIGLELIEQNPSPRAIL
jgi:threonine dehydratase